MESPTLSVSVEGRPLNIQVRPGSPAERRAYAAGAPAKRPAARAPGIHSTPTHDLHYHGGKTIKDLTFTNFYVGGDGAWDPNDIQSIDRALAAAMADERLNNVMVQYFQGGPITSAFQPSTILAGPPPAVVSQADAEQIIGRLHDAGALSGYDLGSTVFNLMLPFGVVLNDDATPTAGAAADAAARRQQGRRAGERSSIPSADEGDSLHGLGGYHGSVHLGTDTVYYAIGVYSERRADGTDNGIPVFDAPWKNVVATFYHELNEARTDPDVEDAIKAGDDPAAERFLGWTSRQGEECGDFPVFEANPLSEVFQEVALMSGAGVVPVQFQYSDAVHGPEGPRAAPAPPA